MLYTVPLISRAISTALKKGFWLGGAGFFVLFINEKG